jgi:SAM-dependent methyltransferase
MSYDWIGIRMTTTLLNSQIIEKLPVSRCRFCGEPLQFTLVDLGAQPPCESFIGPEQKNQKDPVYPLHVYVCDKCFLVQLEEFIAPRKIFTEYAYFSSYSKTWLKHAKEYAEMITRRLKLNQESQVVEIASNDGYLLQYIKQKGIPVLGVEPAANVAKVAVKKGIPTLVKFFNLKTAVELVRENKQADLLIGNNVLAQVPDLNGFVEGMKTLLKPSGVITMEFPHLMELIEGNQFDTIYHEHFSYFSLFTVERIFAHHGLTIYDVETLPTHGGSLRIYARHVEDNNPSKTLTNNVYMLRRKEKIAGLNKLETYQSFSEKVKETENDLKDFLLSLKRNKKTIVGYGAPGKGNTLLNSCGISVDLLEYTVDQNPYKQGKFLPGSHIPILLPDRIKETKPDYVLILPWNIKEEIINQASYIGEWGGRFVVPIPRVTVFDAEGVEISFKD